MYENKFIVVRHPIDRFKARVSWALSRNFVVYTGPTDLSPEEYHRRLIDWGISVFAAMVEGNDVMRCVMPQTFYISQLENAKSFQLVKIEDLNKKLQELGLPVIQKNHSDIEGVVMTPEQEQRVLELYKDDLALWNSL